MLHQHKQLFNACIKALEDLAPRLPEKDKDYLSAFTSCAKAYTKAVLENRHNQQTLSDLLAKYPAESGKASNLLKKIIALNTFKTED